MNCQNFATILDSPEIIAEVVVHAVLFEVRLCVMRICIKQLLQCQDSMKMERCAEFLARMIEKYGREVLEEIEAGESGEKENKEQ